MDYDIALEMVEHLLRSCDGVTEIRLTKTRGFHHYPENASVDIIIDQRLSEEQLELAESHLPSPLVLVRTRINRYRLYYKTP